MKLTKYKFKGVTHLLLLALGIFWFGTNLYGAKPNVIFIFSDDHATQAISAYGSKINQTPNIDRIAREGALFGANFCTNSICGPSRASILTGKHSHKNGFKRNGNRFDPEQMTFPKLLQKVGYRTAVFGKWHLGTETFGLPEHHGFDVNVGGNPHGKPGNYFYPYNGKWKIPTTSLRAVWNVLPDGKDGEYLTDRLTDEAVAFIHENKSQPFFLYFPHYGVHTPIQAKDEVTAKYASVPKDKRQGMPAYAAMVESIDDSVGRVLATLEKLELTDNTVVIFTSDNGGFYKATSNAPLRANKGAYYEGGIRVPLIVKWPGVSESGLTSGVPVTSSDLYPTCLAAAGLPMNQNQHQDGVNLKPLLNGQGELPERSLYWHYPHYNSHPSSVPSSVIRRGDWKLIQTLSPLIQFLGHLVYSQ